MLIPNPEATASRSGGSPAARVLVLAVVLAALLVGAYAGLRYARAHSGPRAAAVRFLEDWKARDYEKLYSDVTVPPAYASLVPNAGALRNLTQGASQVAGYSVFDAVESGENATVKISIVAPDTRVTSLDLTLRRIDGRWKVDLGSLVEQELRGRGAPSSGFRGFKRVEGGRGGGVPWR